MRIVTSTTHEFLVHGRKGRLRNLGCAARALRLPGDVLVRVSGTKQEAEFALSQESQDGIPLRFKGLVVYRVVDPVAAASAFDFAGGVGLQQIREMIVHVALGELRDVVSRTPLETCIEGRREHLSASVAARLRRVVEAEDGGGRPWGIALDVVQVSQVYVVDDDLRRRIETERRNEVEARAERSNLDTKEALERARLASRRRLEEEGREHARASIRAEEETEKARRASERRMELQALEDEKASHEVEKERLELQRRIDAASRAVEGDSRRLELEQQQALLPLMIEVERLRSLKREAEVEREVMAERARSAIERDLLLLRQTPELAAALASMFQGADLTLYGTDSQLLPAVGPLIDLLARRVRGSTEAEGER